MKKWIFLFLLIFVPQLVCGAEVTQEILDRLGFYETVQAPLLKNDIPWKCGVIEGKVVQYKVSGDILGYSADTNEWFRLITPMSTEVPVTALSLFLSETGAIKRQIVVMGACTPSQKLPTKSQEVEESPPSKGEQVSFETMIVSDTVQKPQQEVVESLETVVETETTVTEVPVKRERQVTEKGNIDVVNVSSTWELMAIYQKQMGGN